MENTGTELTAPSHLHTDSHRDYMPEMVPPGVRSNLISRHMQDEDGHTQSLHTHQPVITRLQSYTHGFNHRGDMVPFQGW